MTTLDKNTFVIDKEEFARRFKQLREGMGITQKEFAAMLEVKRSTVGAWETAYRLPEIEKAQMAAKIFNVPLGYLVGEEVIIKNKEITGGELRIKMKPEWKGLTPEKAARILDQAMAYDAIINDDERKNE